LIKSYRKGKNTILSGRAYLQALVNIEENALHVNKILKCKRILYQSLMDRLKDICSSIWKNNLPALMDTSGK
jgi:hypothetical protein